MKFSLTISSARFLERQRCEEKYKMLLEHDQQRSVPIKKWWKMFLMAALIWTASCVQGCIHEAAVKNERMSKVSQELTTLYDEYSRYLASRQMARFKSYDRLVQIIDGRVLVDAVASDDANTLKSDLEGLGMQQAVAFGRIVSGQLPILAIPSMATLPSLNSARAASAVLQGGPRSLPPGTPNR